MDRSGLGEQVGEQRQRVARRLANVKRVVAVMSGKGGVGKSHVTAILARGLAEHHRVGVLDGDLRSPTVARLLAVAGPLSVMDEAVAPAISPHGVRVMSTDLLLDEDRPLTWREPDAEQFVWRGALETGALREFLSDVDWGALDYLLVDLPPGADGVSDLLTLVPDLAGAVVVTIPSEESFRSVRRTMTSAVERGITVLGVVENMSGYRCGGCGERRPLFAGDAGAQLAAAFGVPLLGSIPFSPEPNPEPISSLLAAFEEATT